MKKNVRKPLLSILAAALLAPIALMAQPAEKEKIKEKEKKDVEQIIITRKNAENEKIVVEVNGDKVTVNGKPIEDYKGDDVMIRRNKSKDSWSFGDQGQNWGMSGDNFKLFNGDSNRAMLGVTTDKADKGVEIQNVTKESAAARAGLKEGDVITKINDKKIAEPDDLSAAIKSQKPGDKVNVTFLRDDKEQKTTAELGKWKGSNVFSTSPDKYKFDMGDMNLGQMMPKIHAMPRGQLDALGAYGGSKPKLGLSVQDTDDGKGVKVIEVDDESNAAKAGIKDEDLITEVEGKSVKSADEVAKIIKDSKDKNSVMIKLLRGSKTHNIEVKIPRKLKTADL